MPATPEISVIPNQPIPVERPQLRDRLSSIYDKSKARAGTIRDSFRKLKGSSAVNVEEQEAVIENGEQELDILFAETPKTEVSDIFQEAFLDEEQGEQEPSKHPNLARIDEFPEKAREPAEERYKKAKAFADEIGGYIKDATLVSKTRDLNWRIGSEIGMPYGHYATSQEYARVVDNLYETLAKAREELEGSDEGFDELTERLSRIKEIVADTEKENEAFPDSRQLLMHTVGFNLHTDGKDNHFAYDRSQFSREVLGNILTTGTLASRKYQIDTQGKSYANTGGGVVIGKEFIDYMEGGEVKRIPKADYHKLNHEAHGIREPEREEYQLFFGPVGKSPDGKGQDIWGPYFHNGVTFVFSKPSLYSQSQFNEPGEIELYDKNYDDSNPDSPGFHVDLAKEPMLIVVDEAIRGDFLEFAKRLDSRLWQDKGQDVDTWLQDNVVFAPTGNYQNDADKLRDVYKGIEARFFEKNSITIPSGRFLPTGNKSNHRGTTSIYQPEAAA